MAPDSAIVEAPAQPAAPPAPQHARARDTQTGKFAPKQTVSDEDVRAQLAKEFPDDPGFKAPKTAKTEAKPDAPAKAEAAPAEAKTEQPAEAAKVEPDKALSKAIDVLKRAQIPASVVEKMDRDEKLAAAKAVRGQVVESQQLHNRLVELEKKQGQSIAGNEPATGSAAKAPESPRSNPREALKALAPLYGDEAVKAFGSIIEPLIDRLDIVEQTTNRSTQASVQRTLNDARAALGERFPQLEDEDDFQEALPIMVKLESTGLFDTSSVDGMKELITQAAAKLRWTAIEPQQKESEAAFIRARDNGTATSKTKSGTSATRTKEEKEDLAAELAMDSSISIEEARRRVHG